MHTIHKRPITFDDFSHEHLNNESMLLLGDIIEKLNMEREDYLLSGDKDSWWQMIQLLPSSYNQKRTLTMTYENVMSMINQRQNHKLDEWVQFCKILRDLPYVEAIRDENS